MKSRFLFSGMANVRLGFATNSSSSHAIIMLPEGVQVESDVSDGFEFGWGDFTLASPETKREYVFAQLYEHYRYHGEARLSPEEALLLANGIMGTDYDPSSRWGDDPDVSVDHQSQWDIPAPLNSRTKMEHLVQYFETQIIQNDRVVIVGGNDNSYDDEMSELNKYPRFDLPSDDGWRDFYLKGYGMEEPFVFLYDPQGHIAFFNRRNGHKHRTNNLTTGEAPLFGTAPELMDIKITDCCTKGCEWCMEGSTPDGAHAPFEDLRQVAWQAQQMGVFEVAIGGGEPTSHPKFADILQVFHEHGVVPNFSTGTMEWLDKPEIVEAIKKYCGSVAYSTNSPEEAKKWLNQAEKKLGDVRLAVHFIVGISPKRSLEAMLKAMRDKWGSLRGRLVLLGFKQRGAGVGFKTQSVRWWEVLQGDDVKPLLKAGNVAVDTELVPEVGKFMPEIDPRTYEVSDGKFSMFYDAVTHEVAAASHVDERFVCRPMDIAKGWRRLVADITST